MTYVGMCVISGELLLRSVQPRDYPSVPSGLPTVASLEREGPSLPYPGLVDTNLKFLRYSPLRSL